MNPSAQARHVQPEPLSDAVHWGEGMLLSPQHLQQSDVYWQQQLRYRLALLKPCHWGLAELAVDETLLGQGQVRIERLECVMPDGTPVVYPGSYTELPLNLDMAAALSSDTPGSGGAQALRLWLLMPRRLGGSGDGALRRHDVVEGEMVVDENTGGHAVPVDRLRPRIQLWLGTSYPAAYQACPLLELAHSPERQRHELTCYHPPMLRLGAAEFLGRSGLPHRLRALNRELWLKLQELGGHRRDDAPEDAVPVGGEVLRQLEMARRLALVLPRLGLLAARPEASPLAVYDLLAELAGAMAGFGANPIVPMFDVYRHEDCEPQFARALEYIERKLSYVNTGHEWLEFKRLEPGRFEYAQVPAAARGFIIELRGAGIGPSAAERAQFDTWLSNVCIASETMRESAIKARVSARHRPLDAHERAQMRLRADAALYRIDNDTLGGDALLVNGDPVVVMGQPGSGEPAAVLLVRPRAIGASTEPLVDGHA